MQIFLLAVIKGTHDLGEHLFSPATMKPAGTKIVDDQFFLHPLGAHASQGAWRNKIVTIDHVVFTHNRHGNKDTGNPVLVGNHPAAAVMGRVNKFVVKSGALLSRINTAPLAHSFTKIKNATAFNHGLKQFTTKLGIMPGIFDNIEIGHVPARSVRDAQLLRG